MSFRAALALVVFAAFVLRFAVRLVLGEDTFWSEGYTFYGVLADQLRAGEGYAYPGLGPTAGRVPLYPAMLATLGGTAGPFALIAAVQAAVSAGSVAVAGLLARDRFGAGAGLVAAALAAIYPYAVVHDTALQESGLFAFIAAAATLALWRLGRADAGPALAVLAGVLLGGAILTRAALAPFALLALGWVAWHRGKWRHAAIVAAALAITIAPWVAWTHHVTGQWTISSDTGRMLWAGNNADTFAAFPAGSMDESQAAAYAQLSPVEQATLFAPDEATRNRLLAQRATGYIAAHPLETAVGAARKLAVAVGPLPSPRMSPPATAIYLAGWLPVLLLGIAGLWSARSQWRHDALIHAHFVAFAAVTALFWAHTSHRAYLDLYLIVFAAGWIGARLGLEPARRSC